MPRTRECDFCGDDIEPGTGTMFVQNDGSTVMFCSSKCEKNADLGREARDVGWTEAGRTAGGKRAAETADEPDAEPEAEEEAEPEDAAATEADVVEDTGAAPDLEDAESEATPGPEGEGADEAAADADADSAEAVDEDAEADDGDEEEDAEEEEAEA